VLKQHYLVDAVAAVVLVELSFRWFSKGNRHKKLMDFFEFCNRKIGIAEKGERTV
jgi:hypothetical protein